MDIRSNDDGQVLSGTGMSNAAPACGELILGGGTAYASGANPAAATILGTGVTAGGRSLACTESAAAGSLTVLRTGDYDVELNVADYSSATASGNVQFDVFVNAAAFATTNRLQCIRVAATAKAGLLIKKRVRLSAGDVVTCNITSAAGGIQTVTEGVLRVTQVKDLSTKTTIRE